MTDDSRAQAPLGRLERGCLIAAGLALVSMMLMIGTEVLARSVFHYSFEVVDELGGYLLVALSFLSLAPALASGSFHSVELVQARLSAAARQASQLLFTALSLGFALVMTLAIARYVWRTFVQGDVAPTGLQTPLWIPQTTMLLGMLALALALLKQLRKRRHDA
jgi:TRAP-type C4-dicarboxylate transport system permease small subunit